MLRNGAVTFVAMVASLSFPGLARAETKTDIITYHDSPALWVLGQVASVQNQETGLTESATTFHPTTARPIANYSFGKLTDTATYASDGTLSTISDGRGNVTTLQSWKRGVPGKWIHPDNASITVNIDDLGQITSLHDEEGYKTCYGYDGGGRMSSITYPSMLKVSPGVCDTTVYNQTTFTFEFVNVAEYDLPAGHWRQIEATGNAYKVSFYDALMRPLLVAEYDAVDVAGTQRFQRFQYDHEGKKTFASYPGTTAGLTTGTWTSYDAVGRAYAVTSDSELGALTTLTEFLPNGRVKTTNPRNAATTVDHQVFDVPDYSAPIKISQGTGSGEAIVNIVRDLFGKPKSIEKRNVAGTISATRSYVYDQNQRLCKVVEPETGATIMDYDGSGNLQWSASGLTSLTGLTDCNTILGRDSGRKVTRYYNSRNQLESLLFPDGRGNQTWEYSRDGLPQRVTTDNNGTGVDLVYNKYSYTRKRLLESETVQHQGGSEWLINYIYDRNGHLASQSYPSGLEISFAPNALGQATRASDQSGYVYLQNASYYPNGAVKQFTYGNGILHSMTQNARQLPLVTTDSGGTHRLQYSYDANGNVDNIYDLDTPSKNRYLFYDEVDRLTAAGSATFGGSDHYHRFTYNALDNMTSWKHAGVKDYAEYVYDQNRLASIKNTAGATIVGFGYDPQGNIQNKNGVIHDFDFGNRLRGIIGKETYMYDGQGRRLVAVNGAGGIWTQYSLSGQQTYIQSDRTGNKEENIYLAGSIVATRVWNAATGYTAKFHHTDALGSPVAVTNQAGIVVERNDYEPYGTVIGKPSYQGIGYTGHVQDAATGLTYMQQRYYDPQIGVFLSTDPVDATSDPMGQFHRYRYANSNPYKYTDPDGRFGVVGALIGAGIEAGMQIATQGKVTNWTAVGVAGAVGAVTGGLGGVIGKAAVSGTVTVGRAAFAAAAVGGAANATGKVVEGALTGKPASAKEVAVAAAAGMVGGGVGARIGLNRVAKLDGMAAGNGMAGYLGRTTQAAAQQGGKIVEPRTATGQKVAQTAADTAVSYLEKKANR
jgi:RHS repeat-associated protein